MKKSIHRAISVILITCLLLSAIICFSGCSQVFGDGDGYTFRTYTSALGSNWNPHTWEGSADSQILGYLSTPLVDISIKDSSKGIYTWVYEMATSITDVTSEHKDDIQKYGAILPEGKNISEVYEGYVFEIKLNENATWQNGDKIDADDYIYSMQQLLSPDMKNYRANLFYSGESAIAGAYGYYFGDTSDFSDVGLYKVDEYTIRYVTKNRIDYNYFLNACTSGWLVYRELYEAGKKQVGDVTVTNYGTSVDTTMSYGPYKLVSMQTAKQAVFEQNENWYGYDKEGDRLVSYTNFEVDGNYARQYQTTKIIIDVLDTQSAKNSFLRGELSEWVPSADELYTYSSSDRLYKNAETYTMSLFFNTDVNTLKRLDTQTNKNSIVLSNKNFRHAMSLCIDRNRFVSATQGYIPEYTLLNNLYFYDIYNDPTSSYRNSTEAMRAICDLYGAEYGKGKPYRTLHEAYSSITGYDPISAKQLMVRACDELVSEGLYKRGEDIVIRVGWSKGTLSADDNKQLRLLEEFLNTAVQDSGFGKIRLEGVGNIENRYSAVPAGEYAIGYGAWGGAAFYPFRSLEVYMDPDQYSINEAGCYDPRTEDLTLTVKDIHVTKTWQAWSGSLTGSGEYSSAPTDVKLSILSQLEAAFLETYYRIPLCSSTTCTMLSYQCDYPTEKYNIMYGYGGIRLLRYHYNDGEWASFLKHQKNSVNYE